MPSSAEHKLYIKEYELKSLIDAIRLTNLNQSKEELFRIYELTLHAHPHIEKMALYVFTGNAWRYQVGFGTAHDYRTTLMPPEFASDPSPAQLLPAMPPFHEFDAAIPSKQQGQPTAFTFLGFKAQAETEGMDPEFLETFCQIIMVTWENKRMQQYRSQFEVAYDVQALLFPKSLPYTPQRKAMASYLPHHRVGGDYYDYISFQDGSFLMCVADVSGKGVPAALLMSNFQSGLRLLAKQRQPLLRIVEELNWLVMSNAQGEHFITAFFLLYEAPERRIRYVNAGHNPPFAHIGGQWLRLHLGTTLIGGFDELPFMEEGVLEDVAEFFVFAFTDGFTENYNEQEELFGEDRLLEFLQEHTHLELPVLHEKLMQQLQRFAGSNEYADDVTLLSCKVSP
jgi:sigma-B regulation protein RsbU (phosphoserine phosphatase)